MSGQTVGKRLLDVQVYGPGGARPSAGAVAGRTLLRVVDFLPVMYLVGFITMMATGARRQRIGDLAARTGVIGRHGVGLRGAVRRRLKRLCPQGARVRMCPCAGPLPLVAAASVAGCAAGKESVALASGLRGVSSPVPAFLSLRVRSCWPRWARAAGSQLSRPLDDQPAAGVGLSCHSVSDTPECAQWRRRATGSRLAAPG